MIRFGVSALVTAGWSPDRLVASIMEGGYQGVEWRIHPAGPIRPASLAADVRAAVQAATRAGLVTIGAASYSHLQDVEGVRRDIGIAVDLGAPRLRPLWPAYDGMTPAESIFETTRASMQRLVPALEAAGVTVVVKTHRRSIVPTASAARRLVEGFPPATFRVLYDPGNTVTSGLEDPRYAVDVLGSYLAHVHVKNSGWFRRDDGWGWGWMALGEGMVDWPRLLAYLAATDFDDWLINENFLLLPLEQRPALDEIVTHLRSFAADLDQPLSTRLGHDLAYLRSHLPRAAGGTLAGH